MNQMHELETRLRSWGPRPPSARLKERLFAQPVAAAAVASQSGPTEENAPRFRLSWLAPAALALLVIGIMFNQRSLTALSPGGDSRAIVAVALSNQNAAPWLPGSFARDQNTIPAETFEWTNDSRPHSAIR